MKPTFLLPIVTAIAGFAAGWLLKPEPAPAPAIVRTPPPRPAPAAPTESIRETPETPVPRTAGGAKITPDTADTSANIRSQDDAKLARLTEALNFSDEQKAAVLKAMTAAEGILNPEATLDPSKMLETAATAGTNLEKALAAILTPEQAAAFEALRKRSQENSIENTAQTRLSDVAKLTDLSPEQREKILEAARNDVRTGHQSRPAGLDLVLDTSVLPLGTTFIADSSVDLMMFSQSSDDPTEVRNTFMEKQRQNLDAQLGLYEGILTPAQFARLKVDIEERKMALDRVKELTR